MERFIRSLSLRKKDCPKNVEIGDSNKPQAWLDDQRRVRESSCSFPVEYLGYIEVFESRGIVVCEKAIKALKSSKSKCKKSVLYVSGDAIRVIDDANKVLLVDQTLEKVSFCAPDRNIYEGFAYICRDATAKRWLCHGFLATKDSGERLSHALGCAFAVCLEKKQIREKQKNLVSSSSYQAPLFASDKNRNGDSQFGSSRPFFRQASLFERISDPQVTMVTEPVPSKPAIRNEFEIKRPRPSSDFFKRQHSLQLQNNGENHRRSEFNFSTSNYTEDGDVFTIYEENITNSINNNKDGSGDEDNNNADNRMNFLSDSCPRRVPLSGGVDFPADSYPDPFNSVMTHRNRNENSLSPSIHDISTNQTRKLSDAECWLNDIAESLSISNGNSSLSDDHHRFVPLHAENGSSFLYARDCGSFLSVSNPFSFGVAFDNKIPFKSQVSVPENSLAAFGSSANPFL